MDRRTDCPERTASRGMFPQFIPLFNEKFRPVPYPMILEQQDKEHVQIQYCTTKLTSPVMVPFVTRTAGTIKPNLRHSKQIQASVTKDPRLVESGPPCTESKISTVGKMPGLKQFEASVPETPEGAVAAWAHFISPQFILQGMRMLPSPCRHRISQCGSKGLKECEKRSKDKKSSIQGPLCPSKKKQIRLGRGVKS